MNYTWASNDRYEQYMGRWSSLVATSFLQWLAPAVGKRWLDAGCGSGAISALIAQHYAPAALTAVDRSAAFVRATVDRLDGQAWGVAGDVLDVPIRTAAVDTAVSGLVLNFTADPQQAINELRRVKAPGGTVAVYIWDYNGIMEFLSAFWTAAIELDPQAASLNQADRFADANAQSLQRVFAGANLSNIATQPILIETRFQDFDDYWRPFLGGQGPAPTYVHTLGPTDRERLRRRLQAHLPAEADGTISLRARAWAARGTV